MKDPKQIVGSLGDTAKTAIKEAPRWQRGLIYGIFAVAAIAVCVIFTPPYDTKKQLSALSIAVILVLADGLIIYRITSHHKKREKIEALFPLSYAAFNQVHTILDEARKTAFDFLVKSAPELADDQVRANVFFPVRSSETPGYVLQIYSGLHIKMDRPEEIAIKFGPGQGATGRVFRTGIPQVAQRLDSVSNTGGWDQTYNISASLAAIIHPELQWIMSMPLKKGKNDEPIAVMNIDGLVHNFNIDLLYECMGILTPQVVFAFATIIGT